MQKLVYIIVKRDNPDEILWWGREMGWGSYIRCTRLDNASEASALAEKVGGTSVPLNDDETAMLDVLAATVGLKTGLLV